MKSRFVEPLLPSDTLGLLIDSDGSGSSSVIVRVTAAGPDTPVLVVVPVTDTIRSASSRLLFTAVIVTCCCAAAAAVALEVSFASMVSVVPLSVVPAGADSVIVVTADDDRFSDAVIVVELPAPLSLMVAAPSTNDSLGASSSSMVSVTDAGFADVEPDTPPEVVPDTVTSLSPSDVMLSTAVTVTVPVLAVEPAANVSVVAELRVKSSAAAFVPAAASTSTVICSAEAWLSVAVTVDTLVAGSPDPAWLFSSIIDGVSTSVTVGASSSSVIVPVPLAAVADRTALVGLPSAMITVSFGSSVSSPVTDTVKVSLVLPAANVTVPAADDAV